jgi:hypothetical protein
MSKAKAVDPLRDFLEAVVTRIENLEMHCGISASPSLTASSSHGSGGGALQKTLSSRHVSGAGTYNT